MSNNQKIDYKEYLKSQEWKNKRTELLWKDDVACYCCGTEKWKHRIYRCKSCGDKFLGDKWDYIPTCLCGDDFGFEMITDGKEYFQLHHITYKNFKNEKDKDLIILCEDCHMLVHCLIKIYPLSIKTAPEFIRKQKLKTERLKKGF